MSASSRSIPCHDERGFTLVEVLFAAFLLLVGMAGMFAMLDTASGRSVATQEREAATNLAREVVEQVGAVRYDDLTAGNIETALRALPGLASEDPTTWTLTRRVSSRFTLSATACTVDDAVDGFGSHAAGGFCPQNATTGTQDGNADDLRRITVEVRWRRDGRDRTVRQAVVLGNPGNAAGPAVTGLTPSRPSPLTSDTAPYGVTWTAAVPPQTTKIIFKLDGVTVDVDTTPGNGWSWTWDTTNVGDCDYTVTAQAYDAQNRSRGVLASSYHINRRLPTAPAAASVNGGFRGGRNGRLANVVDLDWSPGADCDVFSYRVYRDGQTAPVCTLTQNTRALSPQQSGRWPVGDLHSCSDGNAPTGSYTYRLAAVDRDPTNAEITRESPRTALVVGNNGRPSAGRDRPANVVATKNADGTISLSWTHAANGNAMTSVDTEYYRVYRDGIAFGNRIGRTGSGADLQFTDDDDLPAGVAVTYYVTAVGLYDTGSNERYGETDASNGVTVTP